MIYKKKNIFQIHDSGCLFACLAMIKNTSYESIIRKLLPDRTYVMSSHVINVSYFNNHDIPNIFKILNIKYKKHNNTNIDTLKRDAFLILKWNDGNSHCAYYNKKESAIYEPSPLLFFNKKVNEKFYKKFTNAIYTLY